MRCTTCLCLFAILLSDQRAVQLLEQPTDQHMWISRFLVLLLQRFTSPEQRAKRRFNASNCLSMLLEGTLKATHAAWTKYHKHKLPGASMKGSNAKEETERVLYLQYVYTQAYVYTSIYIYFMNTTWSSKTKVQGSIGWRRAWCRSCLLRIQGFQLP